LNELKS